MRSEDMRLIETCFCFDIGALTGEHLMEVITSGLGFEPRRISCDDILRRRGRFRPAEHMPMIAKAEKITDLELAYDTKRQGPDFTAVALEPWGMMALYWRLPDCPPGDILEKLTAIPGFNAGYVSDSTRDGRVVWSEEIAL